MRLAHRDNGQQGQRSAGSVLTAVSRVSSNIPTNPVMLWGWPDRSD